MEIPADIIKNTIILHFADMLYDGLRCSTLYPGTFCLQDKNFEEMCICVYMVYIN